MKTQYELRSAIAESLDMLTAMREWVFTEAESLCQEFWRVRGELQQEYIRSAPRHVGLRQRLYDGYAPLKLAWRNNKGSLELYWMTISHGRHSDRQTRRGDTIKKQLPRGKTEGVGYSDRVLKRYARPWELDWVRATELRATCLRGIYLAIHPAKVDLRLVDDGLAIYGEAVDEIARNPSLGIIPTPAGNLHTSTLDQSTDPALNHPLVAPAPQRQGR